jgi:hypothetical protein
VFVVVVVVAVVDDDDVVVVVVVKGVNESIWKILLLKSKGLWTILSYSFHKSKSLILKL